MRINGIHVDDNVLKYVVFCTETNDVKGIRKGKELWLNLKRTAKEGGFEVEGDEIVAGDWGGYMYGVFDQQQMK
ncbi:hypothetical protein M8C21_021423 [Ambrosia artemisiifolia]|uniref:Uncharacterized protein n=1 Tax=Ambrosia artemisiifolia TaxID=4212 RepID=A0AAD5D653_AMBAR|nr:hypothetical protein M8C21_021423 [Ambrosia artemisiifolia]